MNINGPVDNSGCPDTNSLCRCPCTGGFDGAGGPLMTSAVPLFREPTDEEMEWAKSQVGGCFGEYDKDGIKLPRYASFNVAKHAPPGSALDRKIRHIFDLLPEASVNAEVNYGQRVDTFSDNVMVQIRIILTKGGKTDEWKANQLAKIIGKLQD